MLKIQQSLSRRFYMLLSLPSTAMGFALSVQISALSWLLSTQYGLDIHEIGIVWAAGPIAGILGQVIVGFISDKVWFWNGRRRPFILIGGVLASLSLLALPNIGIISESLGGIGILAVAIAIALSLDLSINVSFNPTRSIIADVTPEGEARTKGYTWMQTVSGTFGVLAYVIGGYWNNFVLIYFGAALVLLFSILPTFFVIEPKELPNSGENQETDKHNFNIVQVLKDIKPLWGFLAYSLYASVLHLSNIEVSHYWGETLALLVTLFFVFETLFKSEDNESNKSGKSHLGFQKVLAAHSFSWIGIQTMFVFTYAFLQEKMTLLSDDELGQTISYSFAILNGIAALLPALALGPLANKFGRIKVHAAALLVTAFAYLYIALFTTSPISMYIMMAFAGVGWAAIVSLPFAIMSERVENSKMGLYMGLFNLSVVLPQLVVSLGISLFLNKVDDKSMVFIVCAASLLISAVSWLMVKEKQAD
ncbi:MFS transporter [Psychrosphaera haliotis]|uniref:MFS transporter n=1 Tax=Psychrosphaera haliotis TaxID=555083 RepID=UPI0023718B0A|nr:MFS transporter [Psychrosphaera haliotis]